jgi:hypothetical protein
MADIKAIAEELAKMYPCDIQEMASMEMIEKVQEQAKMAECAKMFRDSSPKQYGISLLNRKHKKR